MAKQTDPLMAFFDDCPVDALVTVRHAGELVAWVREHREDLLIALGVPTPGECEYEWRCCVHEPTCGDDGAVGWKPEVR